MEIFAFAVKVAVGAHGDFILHRKPNSNYSPTPEPKSNQARSDQTRPKPARDSEKEEEDAMPCLLVCAALRSAAQVAVDSFDANNLPTHPWSVPLLES